ncbi:acyltransferase family protein [Arthrobacter woluwensis]|uniref:acyltransferase family protein n=1 Tax=Arthrobacter woluwensis TaxID=156980 RepID=UPI001AB0096F|nr:acyltransferase [Arthrobacter woluwensis]QTF71108.1 acyltransferase [Arthrobacter woluwensis]
MSQSHAPAARPAIPAGRDLTLDLARVACVLVVVFVHLVLVGVGRNPDGSPLLDSPVTGSRWVAPVSWVAEIMPLFFVVGGFAARTGWDSAQARGESPGRFVRSRLARLARPALPLYCFLATALLVVKVIGLDPALVSAVEVPVGSVLWFLGAYLLVQSLAPWMIRWHERAPWLTLIVLLAAALVVDIIRLVVGIWALGLGKIDLNGYGTGDELFGIPNVAFVWLFAQQIGFCLKDGWFSRLSWWQLLGVVALGFLAIGALVGFGSYSTSMLSNQWPPTTPIAILAPIQAALFTLLRRPLTALMRQRWLQAVVFAAGSRLMTIYLWHVTAIVVLTGIQLLLPLPMPAPGSTAWWLTRPIFLVAVFAVVWVISLGTARLERPVPEPAGSRVSPAATVVAVVLFVLPSIGISAYGLDLPLAIGAVLCTAASLLLIVPRGSAEASRPTTAGSVAA